MKSKPTPKKCSTDMENSTAQISLAGVMDTNSRSISPAIKPESEESEIEAETSTEIQASSQQYLIDSENSSAKMSLAGMIGTNYRSILPEITPESEESEVKAKTSTEIQASLEQYQIDSESSSAQISFPGMIEKDCGSKLTEIKPELQGNKIQAETNAATQTTPEKNVADTDNTPIQLIFAGMTEIENESHLSENVSESQESQMEAETSAEIQTSSDKYVMQIDDPMVPMDESKSKSNSQSTIENCVARLKAQLSSNSSVDETSSEDSPYLRTNIHSPESNPTDAVSRSDIEQETAIIAFLETGECIPATDLERNINPDNSEISNSGNPKSRKGKKARNVVFQCAICEKKFKKSYHLVRHQETHTRKKKLTCEVCEKTFKRKLHLQKHVATHSQGKTFECENCHEKFTIPKELKKHKNSHICEQPFDCEVCGKTFKLFYYLKEHLRVHSGKKPFQCSSCSKAFNRPSHLKQHQHIHTGEKLFQCTNCNKTFTRSSSLARHQLVHTGEKPFQCVTCEKFFTSVHHLREHERLHTGERPYKCEVCEKRFNHSGNLRKHQRVHTKEKPFKCLLCNKSFNQSSSLNAHKRYHARKTSFIEI